VLSAVLYDAVLSPVERRALGRWRRALLDDIAGDVLEIGAGTGANLAHYGSHLRRLLLPEPDPAMRRRLRDRAAARPDVTTQVLEGSATDLPVVDASLDAVVATLVLCSVPDPVAALAEIRRVLRPGGRLHVIEHVAAPAATRLRRVQHLIDPLWSRAAGGCSLERPTGDLLRDAGFDTSDLHADALPVPVPVVRPIILGTARSD
jgi:ubiquinone/menaquinone biosynthesis C-methylase UbiE